MLTRLLDWFVLIAMLAALCLAAFAVFVGRPLIAAVLLAAFYMVMRADDIDDELARVWGWMTMPRAADGLDELSDKMWAELYGTPLWGNEDEPSGAGDIDTGWPND